MGFTRVLSTLRLTLKSNYLALRDREPVGVHPVLLLERAIKRGHQLTHREGTNCGAPYRIDGRVEHPVYEFVI